MKQKIYGIFSNIDDAKQALGSIKKELLNLADLTIIFSDDQEPHVSRRRNNFEFATEYFIESSQRSTLIWPGLKEEDLSGVGKIQIGSNHSSELNSSPSSQISNLADEDLGIIEREIKTNKVVAIIEAEPELLPKLRLILESNGAEIIAVPNAYN
jgi:hypothetical protein